MNCLRIDIIGRGNVGTHLLKAIGEKADCVMINPRRVEEIRRDSDLYIIAVSDSAIAEVAAGVAPLLPDGAVLAHTSGSTPLEKLWDACGADGVRVHPGVFYPLQTFTKGATLDYSRIPMLIEAADKETTELLMTVAGLFSSRVMTADSDMRCKLHLAGVLACNFTNHLWTLSARYLAEHGLEFGLLKPLIDESVNKMETFGPERAQTGPAVRHDHQIIESHLQELEGEPLTAEIYRLLTQSIETTHPLQENNLKIGI